MNAWWQMWSGLFEPKTCDILIREGRKIKSEEGKVGHGGATVLNPSLRRSTIRWVKKKPPFVNIWERIEELFHEANQNAFGFELSRLSEVQFTEYRGVEGHPNYYGWHEDLSWTGAKHFQRKLSIVIQLSDPNSYTGGDLQLQMEPPQTDHLRTRGTAIVFPSFHRHQVTPVTQGVRYSLVAWHEGPNFR